LVSKTVTLASLTSSTVFATFASFSPSSALLSPTAAYELALAYLSEHFSASAFYLVFLLQLLGLDRPIAADAQNDAMDVEEPAPATAEKRPSLAALAASLLGPAVQLPAPEAAVSFDPERFEREFAHLSQGQAWGNVGNVLFEKEADNWYEEELLRVQMAAKHLPIAISSFTETEDEEHTDGELVRRFLQETAAYHAGLLKRVAIWLKRQQEGTAVWGKWASYQRHVFMFTARLLTVVAVLLPHVPAPQDLEGTLHTTPHTTRHTATDLMACRVS
jgi:hypothetical protein